METPIRILVADDHPVVRDGLVAILGTQTDFLVVGEASNGQEIIERTATLQPDLLLLDLEMPGLDSIEALRSLRTTNPHTQAIIFTAFDMDDRILGAIRAGVKGYILKGASREEIFNAIRIVHQGGSLLQPAVFERFLNQLSSSEKDQAVDYEQLTERETEVLQLLARGLLNKEIAETLFISERTVKFHVSAILRKLNAGNRTEAVRISIEAGIIDVKS
jgi:DNA-binding NarL/FixJ family response regulator